MGHLEGLTILTERTGLTDTNDLGGLAGPIKRIYCDWLLYLYPHIYDP